MKDSTNGLFAQPPLEIIVSEISTASDTELEQTLEKLSDARLVLNRLEREIERELENRTWVLAYDERGAYLQGVQA